MDWGRRLAAVSTRSYRSEPFLRQVLPNYALDLVEGVVRRMPKRLNIWRGFV